MRLRVLGVLDRYLLKQWLATFVLSVIGVPTVAVVIDLAERFSKLSVTRHVPLGDIFLGQLYLFPSKIAILIPAAVLFATVFTLNTMGRHSELTAVQGGGVSFYRLIAPMLVLATLAVPLDYWLQEVAGYSTSRHNELHQDKKSSATAYSASFAFASATGWTWAFREMSQREGEGHGTGILGEGAPNRRGERWTVVADSAIWNAKTHTWAIQRGASFLVSDSTALATFRFQGMRVKQFTETPGDLMKEEKRADEMTTAELQQYLAQLKLSGGTPGALAVELPLKYAVPMACLVVALFGAPLAITNARAGAAIGLAIALGTTLTYLTGTQIMKAIGGKEILHFSPALAAWSMNIFFVVVALILLARVKS
jgi:lipopolysaccharide export system permease protein